MLTAEIIREEKTEYGHYFEIVCGKKAAAVCVYPHGVNVCAKNASHRVWRGAGRMFASMAEALHGYKSAEMQAMIARAASVVM